MENPIARWRGGDAGALMRSIDWSQTPLGPVAGWSQALRSTVSLVLHNQCPMLLWSGPEFVQIYNDAYRPVLGDKHPNAMGQRFRDGWSEVWDIIGPMAERPYRGGAASTSDDLLLALRRKRFLEEAHFRVAYSPVPDETVADTGIGGVLATVTETTQQVYAERQLRTPPWSLRQVASLRQALVVEDLARCAASLPASPWQERPQRAIALPLASPEEPVAVGVLICGVSPHRELDEGYRAFFELAAAQVMAAVRNAQALAAAKWRADELAALDRAKTSFFSNVSHEFRTPLTRMLGPTEDALASPSRALTGASLETVHRNELRLLKLVNNLLDFARLETQRIQASYAPTDISSLTKELAAMFDTAIARAGLAYRIEAETLAEPIYLDRDMYEKIVLNLLSNALKFTFDGAIDIALRDRGAAVELAVRDTGVGVPAAELPRLFERFYRVEGARARTHEGSGIGLALVNDLVRLHGGTVRVESEPGQGTAFFITLPKGMHHLPADRIRAHARARGRWPPPWRRTPPTT